MKVKGVPIKQRKYLLRTIHLLRRGLLTFEYIQSRTVTKPVRKLTKAQTQKAGAKGADKKAKEKK